jgi:hypothetical protein
MRARDRRGAILEKGAIREGCHTTRLSRAVQRVLASAAAEHARATLVRRPGAVFDMG